MHILGFGMRTIPISYLMSVGTEYLVRSDKELPAKAIPQTEERCSLRVFLFHVRFTCT